jgi:hypothetical protein
MARIRTIKPEFWSHPIIGRLDDAAKMLAIALLNMADDEGYFLADPILIRNFARPFDEDSTITRRSIAQLEKSGWIEVSEHDSHGNIGRVVNFVSHQIVDRAKPSKIKDYFDSTNIRRFIDDQSTLEGKGKEGNREGKTKALAPVKTDAIDPDKELFQSINQAFLAKNDNRFTNYPKEAQGIKGIIAKAKARNPEDPEALVRTMLESFWILKTSQDRFWSSQPFLPSTLNSAGLWDRVLETKRVNNEPNLVAEMLGVAM